MRPFLIPTCSPDEAPAFGIRSETCCEGNDRRVTAGFDGSPVVCGGGRLGAVGVGRAKGDVDMRQADAAGDSAVPRTGAAALSLTVPERARLLRRPVGSEVLATGFSSSTLGTLLGVGTSALLTKGDRSGTGISVEG